MKKLDQQKYEKRQNSIKKNLIKKYYFMFKQKSKKWIKKI